MRDWLTIEVVLAVLLVTSFTCVGMLALWAATSPRHWFVRTAVFLAGLSPLLLVPAYEPFVAFVISGAVIACGVQAGNLWRANRRIQPNATNNPRSMEFRFSLSSLLLLTTLIAAMTPVVVNLPPLNMRAWGSVAAIGASCGLIVFVAMLISSSRHKLIAWSIGLLVCLAVGALMLLVDYFAFSLIMQAGWPPILPLINRYDDRIGTAQAAYSLMWPLVLAGVVFLSWAILLLVTTQFGRNKRTARCVPALAIVMIAAFPLFVVWQLLHPLSVPRVQLPSANGYDDLVAAGAIFNGSSPILNTTVEPTSTAELAAEVARFAPAFDRIRVALTRPCEAQVWPTDSQSPISGMSFANIQAIRGVARALDREAELAQQQGRFRDAAMSSIDNMRVAQASARGGLIFHYLAGIAIEGIGQWQLYATIAHLDAKACHETIEMLAQIDQNRESVDEVSYRDRIYDENATGWYGHLLLILSDLADARHDEHWAIREATSRAVTASRLLRIELALRLYHLENGTYPSRLEMLVPKYVPTLPIDPRDANQYPLRYVTTADGYLLYSVGVDGDDDGGRPSSRDSGWLDDGDIRLDCYMAPFEDETVPVTDGDDADVEPNASEAANTADPNQ
jgi:hypothetical protein